MVTSAIRSLILALIIQGSVSEAASDVDIAKEFLTSGLSGIFWKNLDASVAANVSTQCRNSLISVLHGLEIGSASSYRMIDASSKTASGTLEGTAISFGDFDQCLSVTDSKHKFIGSNCVIKLHIKAGREVEVLNALQHRFPFFDYVFIYHSICLPSACSATEINKLVSVSLAKYPFSIVEDFQCDTRESISWETKIRTANNAQTAAALILTFVTALCIMATIVDFCWTTDSLFQDFSLRKSLSSLNTQINAPPRSRLDLLDNIKLGVVFMGVAAHSVTCLETVNSWFLFPGLVVIKRYFRSFLVQPLLNEAGLGLVSFAGGFVCFWSSYKVAEAGKLPIFKALFVKWLRFLPAMVIMVAIDLLWPMYGSGPMFNHIADHLLNKCTRNSWTNFFFINNFITATECCVPHTFYMSIDLQLTAMGLLVTTLIVKRPRMGVMTSIFLIFLGNGLLIYFTSVNQTSPVLIDREATNKTTKNYIDYVHFGTYSHMSNYFIGVLAAYAVCTKGLTKKYSKEITFFYNIAVLISAVIHFAPAIHNTFGLLPPKLVPLYIVTIKFFYVFYFAFFVFDGINRFEAKSRVKKQISQEESNNATLVLMESVKKWYNRIIFGSVDYVFGAPLMRLLLSLSFAVYMSNYSYIRYDFFTTRVGVPLSRNTAYALINRILYTMTFVNIFAFFFHIIFVAPFDSFRRRIRSRGKVDNKEE